MPSSTSRHASGDAHDRGRVFALWTGMLAGPLAFLVLLQYQYTLAYVACEIRQTWFLHLATAVAVVLVSAAGVWGWRAGHAPTDLSEPLTDPVSPATCDARTRWMAMFGALSSAWFVVAILAMEVPVIVLRVCQ